jgi:hypothetical protein
MTGHAFELFDLIRFSIAMTFVLVVLLAYVALDWYLSEYLPPEPERSVTHLTREVQEIDQ